MVFSEQYNLFNLKSQMYSIILLMMFRHVFSKLRILSPEELQTQFGVDNSIPYSVANFGHIPWGRKLIGSVVIAEPFNACESMAHLDSTQGELPFVLVGKGGCSFVTKVRNCQTSGAGMVIIMDDSVAATGKLVMGDDGFGYMVNIPSLVIGEQNGLKIYDYTVSQSANLTPNSHPKQVVLVMKFDTKKAEIVLLPHHIYFQTDVKFALTFQNRESFKLIREFQPYFEKLKNSKVTFQVFYDQYTCATCKIDNFSKVQSDCLGGGQYCQYDPDGDGVATGRQILEEELRQLCIFEHQPNAWMNYIPSFDKECVVVQAYEHCSIQLMKEHNIDAIKIEQCVEQSFDTSKVNNRLLQKNNLLEQQKIFKSSSGVRYYPGAVINNQTYLGAIDAEDIFGEICNSMIEHTQECRDQFDNQALTDPIYIPQTHTHITTIIVVVLLVLTVFFFFMIFIYRRMVRKEMSRDMNTQVNQMVSQYISFYESKEKKNGT